MPSVAVPPSPYVGLQSFSEEDAQFFFGREVQLRVVLANMAAEPFTLLYGPSGVGKSSFLRAGVLRQLHQDAQRRVDAGEPPELAAVVFSQWRDLPLEGLRAAVVDSVHRALADQPAPEPPETLAETTEWAARAVGGTLYLILDQVEEYFLYWPDDHGPGSFLSEFPRVIGAGAGRVSVLLSIREDALAKLDRFKGRIPTLFDNYLRLDQLDRAQGREAIVGPLEALNLMQADVLTQVEPALVDTVLVEPELVDAVLDAVSQGALVLPSDPMPARSDHAGAPAARVEAPLLQVILSRVWSEEVGAGSSVLRLETLQRLGGPTAMLRGVVEGALGALTPADRELAADALRYLITPGGTRVALSASDLAAYIGRPDHDVVEVLEYMAGGEARILRVTGAPDGEGRYELFSDLLVEPLREWRSREEAFAMARGALAPGRRQPRSPLLTWFLVVDLMLLVLAVVLLLQARR
jgi:hypothetical protein